MTGTRAEPNASNDRPAEARPTEPAADEGLHVLALLGLSPAVVTETLWALRQQGKVIASVCLVTTSIGAVIAREKLTGLDGAIRAVCVPDKAPRVTVEIIRTCEGLVADLRTEADHGAMQGLMERLVRSATVEGCLPVHASLAGGRKTMAASLSLAMALHARPGDRMSHVLVDEPWASDPHFLFPSPRDPSSEKAVTLINIPFVRLRGLRSRAAVPEHTGLESELGDAQERIDTFSRLFQLDLANRVLGEASLPDTALALSPLQAALLAVLGTAGTRGVAAHDLELSLLATCYRKAGATHVASSALIHRLGDPVGAAAWLREQISRLRYILSSVQPLVPGRGIVAIGKRPFTRHCLSFELELIGD